MNLGYISEQFESGGLGPGAISNVPDDPGGKSYGIYQLSRLTFYQYVNQAPFKFEGQPFTEEFDRDWIATAKNYTEEFRLDQYLFITKKLYLPVVILARSLGYATNSRKIQEALYSIAVQHGGASKIITVAFSATAKVKEQVALLYKERLAYVKRLSLSDRLKLVLENRYECELAAVMCVAESNCEHV